MKEGFRDVTAFLVLRKFKNKKNKKLKQSKEGQATAASPHWRTLGTVPRGLGTSCPWSRESIGGDDQVVGEAVSLLLPRIWRDRPYRKGLRLANGLLGASFGLWVLAQSF